MLKSVRRRSKSDVLGFDLSLGYGTDVMKVSNKYIDYLEPIYRSNYGNERRILCDKYNSRTVSKANDLVAKNVLFKALSEKALPSEALEEAAIELKGTLGQ